MYPCPLPTAFTFVCVLCSFCLPGWSHLHAASAMSIKLDNPRSNETSLVSRWRRNIIPGGHFAGEGAASFSFQTLLHIGRCFGGLFRFATPLVECGTDPVLQWLCLIPEKPQGPVAGIPSLLKYLPAVRWRYRCQAGLHAAAAQHDILAAQTRNEEGSPQVGRCWYWVRRESDF